MAVFKRQISSHQPQQQQLLLQQHRLLLQQQQLQLQQQQLQLLVNESIMNRQEIPVGYSPLANVKVEPNTGHPMVSGPAIPRSSSVPRAISQGVPMSVSQEMISNNDNVQDLRPIVSGISQPLRPAGLAAANASILNNLPQARQVMNSAALSGGTSIGLQSMGGNPTAMHMSNMISSGMTSSVPAAQTVLSSGQSGITSVGGSGMLAGTAQVAQNTAPGSFTSATSNMSGNSNLGMSQPLGSLQRGISMGQSVPGMSQGTTAAMNQNMTNGIGMNQNMMSDLGPSGMSSGTGTMIPTPGMTQQVQQGMQSIGVNSNSAANMPMSQQASSSLQSAQSKCVKVCKPQISCQQLQQQLQPQQQLLQQQQFRQQFQQQQQQQFQQMLQQQEQQHQPQEQQQFLQLRQQFLQLREQFLQMQQQQLLQMQQLQQQFPQMHQQPLSQQQQQLSQMHQQPLSQQQQLPQIHLQLLSQLQQQQQIPQLQLQQQLVGTGMGQTYVQGPSRSQLVSQGQVSTQVPPSMPGWGFLN